MKTILMTATVVLLSGALCSGAIYENDFNEASDIAGISWGEFGPYTYAEASLQTDYSVSPDSSLMILGAGGGSSVGYFYHHALLPLGAGYDMWAGGAGLVTAQVLEAPGQAWWITIELRENGITRAYGQISHDNQEEWVELVIDQDFDGDETNINEIWMQMVGYKQFTGGSSVRVDDFLATPEPATILMLAGGLSMALRRRRRAA